jgi:hypothetical protein
MTTKAERKQIPQEGTKLSQVEQLLEFMRILNEKPESKVSHADLFHATHLIIGVIGEVLEARVTNG